MISIKRPLVTSILLCLFLIPCLTFSEVLSQDLKDGLYAQFDTNKGQIIAILYYKQVPITIINFAGLAQGTIASDQSSSKKYYDGLIFHRVIRIL
nr:peptidylprolyl isomerase [Desulfobacula sp.]